MRNNPLKCHIFIQKNAINYQLNELIVSYDGKDIADDSVTAIKKAADRLNSPICLLHIRINEDDPIQNLDLITNS